MRLAFRHAIPPAPEPSSWRFGVHPKHPAFGRQFRTLGQDRHRDPRIGLSRPRAGARMTLVTVHLVSPDLAENAGVIERPSRRVQYRRPVRTSQHPPATRLRTRRRFWYLVTEWVDGITLAQMIEAHTRLPEETAVRILTQIGQAWTTRNSVGYAHALSVTGQRS